MNECVSSFIENDDIDIRDIIVDCFFVILLKYGLIFLNFWFGFEYFG